MSVFTGQQSHSPVRVSRWQGSQHPSESNIIRLMRREGLRPYQWHNPPNYRYAVRSHNYHRVIYVTRGTLEVILPDANQRTRLRAGDRVDIPPGVRHGAIVGSTGVQCTEAAIRRTPRHNPQPQQQRRGLFAWR